MACLLVMLIASYLLYLAPSLAQGLPLAHDQASGISAQRLSETKPTRSGAALPDTEVSGIDLGLALPNDGSSISSLLDQNGLPIGLLPSCVESYTLSDDGQFSVSLQSVCYVDFDYEVYYSQTIKGTLSYGTISDLTGIQAKKAFLWVSVTGMHIDPSSTSYIYFDIGPISKRLSISQFEAIPTCKAKAMDFSAFD